MKDNQIAALLIFIFGISGFIFNFIVVVFLRKAKSLANPFGILTLNQAVTDLINSFIFTFIVSPIVFFRISASFDLTSRLGQLLFLAYDCCSWSHLIITLNRFTSIYSPITYTQLFSTTKTYSYVVAIWILAICINFYEYVLVDCSFYLPNGHWNFEFIGGESCPTIEWYINYCRNMFLTACIAILDIATLIRFHLINKRTSSKSENMISQKRKKRQEFFFMAQTMLQSTMFYFELVCCYNIGALPFMTSSWAQFGLRTVAWVCTHALDGLITLVCNGEFRRLVIRTLNGNSKDLTINPRTIVQSNTE